MNEIIKVLMNRDGMSYEDAVNYFKQCQDELLQELDTMNMCDFEDFMADNFGLETDYIFDIL